MKKWLLVIATAVGASIVKKNIDKTKSDKDLWSEATAPKPEAPAKDAWASATDAAN
ncbi:DLW-39 family protein [Nostocoides veronense]|uniref:Uncharacterized protein n=1 Tax=Nostocoides veronense TaxID=330836 RepID=A0ABP4XZC6_9MICO